MAEDHYGGKVTGHTLSNRDVEGLTDGEKAAFLALVVKGANEYGCGSTHYFEWLAALLHYPVTIKSIERVHAAGDVLEQEGRARQEP